MMNAISIGLSGLSAATKQLNASAANVAGLQSAGSLEDGRQKPFNPLTTAQTAQTDTQGNPQGVRTEIVPRQNPFVPTFDPDSPFADENGIIGLPNVNLAEEAVNQIQAELAFKANIATIKAAEELSNELLNIFDEKA